MSTTPTLLIRARGLKIRQRLRADVDMPQKNSKFGVLVLHPACSATEHVELSDNAHVKRPPMEVLSPTFGAAARAVPLFRAIYLPANEQAPRRWWEGPRLDAC